MASIVTRTGKGSILIVSEMDQNLKNLDAQVLKTDLRPSSIPVFRNDILNSGVLDPRVTFSRNSTATYFDKFGVMRTASTGVPRIDYDPITGECRGLLVEEQRTNLLSYSEQFDNSYWYKDNSSVTPNIVISPDGNVTACKLVESTVANYHRIYADIATTEYTPYTISIYAKKAERRFFYMHQVLVIITLNLILRQEL